MFEKSHLYTNLKSFTAAVMLLSVIIFSFPANADDIQKQIDALRNRIESVEEDTTEMRSSLDKLREDNAEPWLTEERANQIKTLVHDVLSDADTRRNFVGDGLLGGWDGGFFLASSDDRFRLKVGGLIQERYILNHRRVPDRWRSGFENTRTRLNISGHIFDRDTTFLIQPGFGWIDPNSFASAFMGQVVTNMGARFWDAWVNFKLSDSWSAKVGIYMLPFTRESLVSDQFQMAVDRSLIDYRVGLGRSQGLQFTYAEDNVRAFMSFSDGSITLGSNSVALANQTPPWSAIGNGTEWSSTGRVEFLTQGQWSQFNTFTSEPGSSQASMLGIAVHVQQGASGDIYSRTSKVDIGVTADWSMNFDGGTFFASGTIINQKEAERAGAINENLDWVGYVLQGSIYTTSTTELFLRFSGGGVMQNAAGGDDLHILTAGANWYLDGQGLKITSDIGWSLGDVSLQTANYMVGWRQSPDLEGQWLFRTQLQLLF
ncbi:MAG: porin [Phycisphaerales bacterium]|nr:porin [Phycisphaerales bacterium]